MDDYSKCFQTLGLEANSSPEQVKKAYRDLVQVWHPDRFSHDERLRLIAQEKLKEINGAYELLKAAFFEASMAPESAQTTEAEATPNEAVPCSPEEETRPTAGKRSPRWVTLSLIAIAVIGAAVFVFLEKGRRKEMGRSPEPRLAQAADSTLTTNQPATIITNAQPAKQLEVVLPVPVTSRWVLSLDVNKSHVEIATKGSLTGTFTVECWALTRTLASERIMVSSRGPKDCGFDLQFGGDRIHSDIGNGSVWLTTQANAPFKYAKDIWYHIACVVTPRYCAFYIDGTLAGSKAFVFGTPVLYDADHQLLVGTIQIHPEYLDGLITELRIWQTARTQLEIRANMNRLLTGTEPGLRGYWRFDEGTGTTARDRTGHGQTGTLVEGANWTTNAPPLPEPGR